MEIIFANKYSLMHRTRLLVSQKTLIRLFDDNMIEKIRTKHDPYSEKLNFTSYLFIEYLVTLLRTVSSQYFSFLG